MFGSQKKTKECLENLVYIRLIINEDTRITKYKYEWVRVWARLFPRSAKYNLCSNLQRFRLEERLRCEVCANPTLAPPNIEEKGWG